MAADHEKAIEKLIATYGTIGEVLPRFNRLSLSLNDDPDLQRILAVVYSDILKFHEEAYKIFKKTGLSPSYNSNSLWGKQPNHAQDGEHFSIPSGVDWTDASTLS